MIILRGDPSVEADLRAGEGAAPGAPEQQGEFPPQQDAPGVIPSWQPPLAPAYPITLQAMLENKDHPLRMKLEWDEIHRAEAIKQAILGTAGLDNVSDFWCAQYALICKDIAGNVLLEEVLERAEALQIFRRQYDIRESYQEGQRALRRLANLCPNYLVAFMYDTSKGNYTVVENPASIAAENFSHRDKRDFMVGMYYCVLSFCSDFHNIHKGTNTKIECKGMGWSKRHTMKLLHKATNEMISFFPFDMCSVKFFNTGVGGAAFTTLLKPIARIVSEAFGEEWKSQTKLSFDSTYLEGLDSVFLVPDAATAQERALRNMEESLRLRFENERRFSLHKKRWDHVTPFTDDMVDAIYDSRRME